MLMNLCSTAETVGRPARVSKSYQGIPRHVPLAALPPRKRQSQQSTLRSAPPPPLLPATATAASTVGDRDLHHARSATMPGHQGKTGPVFRLPANGKRFSALHPWEVGGAAGSVVGDPGGTAACRPRSAKQQENHGQTVVAGHDAVLLSPNQTRRGGDPGEGQRGQMNARNLASLDESGP